MDGPAAADSPRPDRGRSRQPRPDGAVDARLRRPAVRSGPVDRARRLTRRTRSARGARRDVGHEPCDVRLAERVGPGDSVIPPRVRRAHRRLDPAADGGTPAASFEAARTDSIGAEPVEIAENAE